MEQRANNENVVCSGLTTSLARRGLSAVPASCPAPSAVQTNSAGQQYPTAVPANNSNNNNNNNNNSNNNKEYNNKEQQQFI